MASNGKRSQGYLGGKLPHSAECNDRANVAVQASVLTDHLIGLEEQRRGNGEAKRVGGLEVDDQLEGCRQDDR
jgi:hypothetical protein